MEIIFLFILPYIVLYILALIPVYVAGTIIEPFLPFFEIAFRCLFIVLPTLFIWKKTHSKAKSIIIVATMICVYCLFTSDGAVRFGLLRAGQPIAAMSVGTKKYENEIISKETGAENLRNLTKKAPVDRKGRSLGVWEINKYFIFKWAENLHNDYYDSISHYRDLFDSNEIYTLDVTAYEASEDFEIHNHSILKGSVVVLHLYPNGRRDEVRLVAYTSDGRIEELLYDTEREDMYWSWTNEEGEEVKMPSKKLWSEQLPLENKEVSISSNVFAELDSVWTKEPPSYEEVKRVFIDIKKLR